MRAVNLVAGVLGLLAGCSGGIGTDTPFSATCNPACASGCCARGQCLPGTEPAACGRPGDLCRTCPSGTECTDGECTPQSACSAAWCDGCCSGDSCIGAAQQTSEQCGRGGASCASCNGAPCSDGACGAASACNASNCVGCCTVSGQCVGLGEQHGAQCGTGGALCATCPGGGSCVGGMCSGASCNAATCPGGCCNNGYCALLTQQSAALCGNQGQACRSCAPGKCSQGSCTNDPGSGQCARTCTGCCVGEVCVPFAQQSPTACGNYGQTCGQCTGATPSCSAGQCQAPQSCTPESCPDGCCQYDRCLKPAAQSAKACGARGFICQACGAGTSCRDGQCTEVWSVTAVSAKLVATYPNWDQGEYALTGWDPDPALSCTVLLTGEEGHTKPLDDKLSPVWNKELFEESKTALLGGLSCEVVDDDGYMGQDWIGGCNVLLAAGSFAGSSFTRNETQCTGSVLSITLKLSRVL